MNKSDIQKTIRSRLNAVILECERNFGEEATFEVLKECFFNSMIDTHYENECLDILGSLKSELKKFVKMDSQSQ